MRLTLVSQSNIIVFLYAARISFCGLFGQDCESIKP